MSFPDFDALVVESLPSVPGASVRLRLLRRGVELKRERIVALLEAERNRIAETISLPLSLESGDAFIDA